MAGVLAGMDQVAMADAADEDRVGEHAVELAAREGGAAAAAAVAVEPLRRADAGSIEFGLQPADRAEREIALEDPPDQRRFVGHRGEGARLGAVADRDHAAHPQAPRLGGGDLVADALGGELALELAEGQEHVQGQLAHRAAGVEGLGDADEGHLRGLEDRDDAGEVGERPGQPVDLVDQDRVDPAGADVLEQPVQGRAVHRAAGEAAIVIAVGQGGPALVLLAEDIGGAGLALRVERVERLLQPLRGALAGVDRAADRLAGGSAARHGAARRARPKKAGPLRRLPVISRAMTESERQSRPRQ